jgi:hypothetical protein
MKKSELKFKCVVPNKNAGIRIRLALKSIGLIKNAEDDYTHYQFFAYNRGIVATKNAECFCLLEEPLMSYEDALKLIESIESDAPEFDIKPFDKVLWKQRPKIKSYNDTTWHVDFYAGRINVDNFACIGNASADCLLFCNADTLELNNSFDYPAGWWECENGKPVWRTK